MRNDWHYHEVSLTRKQMIDLIINHKDIKIITKKGEKITISKPSGSVYEIDPVTRHTKHTVFSRFTLENGIFLGKITVKTEDNKSYTGTITYQEE